MESQALSMIQSLEPYFIARQRIEHFLQHLTNTGSRTTTTSFDIVPWPGTLQHMEWMNTIIESKSDAALRILEEWKQGFFVSGKAVEIALRRIRVLYAHLQGGHSVQEFVVVKDVW